MFEVNTCQMCGSVLNSRQKKYCRECAYYVNIKRSSDKKLFEREQKQRAKKMQRYHSKSLAGDIAKADALGMTYGQYMANVKRK